MLKTTKQKLEEGKPFWIGGNAGFTKEENEIVFGYLFDLTTKNGKIKIKPYKNNLEIEEVKYIIYKRDKKYRVLGITRNGFFGEEQTINFRIIDNIFTAISYLIKERRS